MQQLGFLGRGAQFTRGSGMAGEKATGAKGGVAPSQRASRGAHIRGCGSDCLCDQQPLTTRQAWGRWPTCKWHNASSTEGSDQGKGLSPALTVGQARTRGATVRSASGGPGAKTTGAASEGGATANQGNTQAIQSIPVDNVAIVQGISQTLAQIS